LLRCRCGHPSAVAVQKYKEGVATPERVKVSEKIRSGIWVYNGLFKLIDCWTEQSGGRTVFKFKLQLAGRDEENGLRLLPPRWKMID
jgi:hypothetical protein